MSPRSNEVMLNGMSVVTNGAGAPTSPDTQMILEALARVIARAIQEQQASAGRDPQPRGIPQRVTLDQAAALVHRSKFALRHYKDLPPPTVPGTTGMANLWDWPAIRPWLEQKFHMVLPDTLPFDR